MAIYYFELDGHGTPCNLGRTLRAFGQQVKRIESHQPSTMPVDLDEVHGVVVCGGGSSVTGSSGSIEAFVRDAAKTGLPILAIGSGARLVARALGGEVSPCSERGIVTVKLGPIGREEPIFAGQPWSSQQAVWNDECVTKLPEGARPFASTPSAKFAAWGLGPWIVAVDWHFEWDAKEIAECAKSQGPVASTTVSSIERLGALVSERASLVLMPVDRMCAGQAKDVRH
ncbi:MAG: synthase [Planctomycetota bacterium]|jgi:GMP synthase-like glutamine amidotransferase